MKIIGITGGVGAGKSRVLEILKNEYGACIIKADEVAHKIMEPGNAAYEEIVKRFGEIFLNEDKTIDRAKMADIIFNDKDVLTQINEITHPLVWNAIKKEIDECSSSIAAVEAALLEKECDDIYDELWYVYTLRENRIQRLCESRGYSREKSESIMSNQPSDEIFRESCSRIIDNNGTEEELSRQIALILKGEEEK